MATRIRNYLSPYDHPNKSTLLLFRLIMPCLLIIILLYFSILDARGVSNKVVVQSEKMYSRKNGAMLIVLLQCLCFYCYFEQENLEVKKVEQELVTSQVIVTPPAWFIPVSTDLHEQAFSLSIEIRAPGTKVNLVDTRDAQEVNSNSPVFCI